MTRGGWLKRAAGATVLFAVGAGIGTALSARAGSARPPSEAQLVRDRRGSSLDDTDFLQQEIFRQAPSGRVTLERGTYVVSSALLVPASVEWFDGGGAQLLVEDSAEYALWFDDRGGTLRGVGNLIVDRAGAHKRSYRIDERRALRSTGNVVA